MKFNPAHLCILALGCAGSNETENSDNISSEQYEETQELLDAQGQIIEDLQATVEELRQELEENLETLNAVTGSLQGEVGTISTNVADLNSQVAGIDLRTSELEQVGGGQYWEWKKAEEL